MARNIQKIMSVNALLEAAARMADIESLYRVIEQDPHVLDNIDLVPFVETPLHVAASINLPEHIQFAAEIMRLKPSFALKLNPQGLTPIHVALQNGCDKMALHLIDINKDLVRAKMRGGLTPLHLASQSGNIGLLTEFLEACPDSIEDVTVTGETALHFAVQNNFETFKFLVKLLEKKSLQLQRTILNRKDKDGNTILHIAALNNDKEAVRLLVSTPIDLKAKNLENKTPLDIPVREDIKSILATARLFGMYSMLMVAEALCVKGFAKFLERDLTEEQRNAFIIVATLITTATYQSVLSPPGGVYQANAGDNNAQGNDAGKSIMSGVHFFWFSFFNTLSFMVSITTTFLLIPMRGVTQLLVLGPTSWFIMSYLYSLWVISPNTPPVIFSCILTSIYCLLIYSFRISSSLPNLATWIIKASDRFLARILY